MKMDSVRTNRTRRQRGYTFEYELVKRMNSCSGWRAIRLGSPSVALPDVVAVNNSKGIMLAIEAKSTSTDTIKVPMEQVARCINWLDLFSRYRRRYTILALKFMSKRWRKAYTYEHRALQEYYWLWDDGRVGAGIQAHVKSRGSSRAYIACRYDGSLYIHLDGANTCAGDSSMDDRRMMLTLDRFTMPWQEGVKGHPSEPSE